MKRISNIKESDIHKLNYLVSPEISEMKKKMTMFVRGIRRNAISKSVKNNFPQSVKYDFVLFGGRIRQRKRIVLLPPACSVATCTMCPLPNEAADKNARKICAKDIIRQIDAAFENEQLKDYEIVTVYSNSNFFADQDMPISARQYIYRRVRKSPASILVVESLPHFITQEKISEAKKILKNKILSVALGLQSANDEIRELAINSMCTKRSFRNVVGLLKKNGFWVHAFLMLKPPFLLEKEAIDDTISSVKYLLSLGIIDSIICPTRVAPYTVVEKLYIQKRFNPPWLWSIVDVLLKCAAEVPKTNPRITISELLPDNNNSVYAKNCKKCTKRIIGAISEYNTTRDIRILTDLDCKCRKDYKKFLKRELSNWKDIPIKKRVAEFLCIA